MTDFEDILIELDGYIYDRDFHYKETGDLDSLADFAVGSCLRSSLLALQYVSNRQTKEIVEEISQTLREAL